jgi:hypothetical protein
MRLKKRENKENKVWHQNVIFKIKKTNHLIAKKYKELK